MKCFTRLIEKSVKNVAIRSHQILHSIKEIEVQNIKINRLRQAGGKCIETGNSIQDCSFHFYAKCSLEVYYKKYK